MLNPPPRRHSDGERSSEPAPFRVLLVDDDPNFRAWMSVLFVRLGLDIETAADGVEALACLRESTFDLLVADYQMPRMDGLELIREIRATPILAHQYSIMLTAYDAIDDKVAALTVGYDDFLSKSCTESEVVAKVVAAKRMLSRHRTLSNVASEWQALASRDELTGVATRRALAVEGERFLEEGRAVGLALFDLDHFKPINDSFGHLTGDRILRDLGALFRSRTRAKELVARYGGDEFVLLVVDLTYEDVAGAAERLIAEIDSLQWTSGDVVFRVSATSGIAHSSLLDPPSLDRLLEAADRDLYANKWLKKHPGERNDYYDYPGRGGHVIPLPAAEERDRDLPPKAADEEN